MNVPSPYINTKSRIRARQPHKQLKPSTQIVENSVCPYCGESMEDPPTALFVGERCDHCGGWCNSGMKEEVWMWMKYPMHIDTYLEMWE